MLLGFVSDIELLVHFYILNQHHRVEIEILNIDYQITTCSNESQSERETKINNHHGKAKTTTQVTRHIQQSERQHESTIRNKYKPYKAL
jgi:hypothetical protein